MADKPNILIFVSDHLSPMMMGAYGDDYGATPAMDNLASRGIRFSRAYTACPLCQPARAAFWTGRFPHETNVLSNGGTGNSAFSEVPVSRDIPTLGEIALEAGYEPVHFGKTHDMGTLRGFDVRSRTPVKIQDDHECWPLNQDSYHDVDTTEKTVAYLKNPPKKPFLAVCDLENPHNICGWVGENQGPGDDNPLPENTALPPLPDNFDVNDWESRPLPVQYICCSHNRMAQASHWSRENYRHYLAAYYYYTSRADRDMSRVLEALNSTPAGENTVVILLADHGDGLARHRMVTKQVSMYEETTRVPLIMAGPGIPGGGKEYDELVSLQDLLPTLCDIMETAAPCDIWGKSLFSVMKGAQIHPYVASEWHTEWGFTVSPGRMIRTKDYKYINYREGNGEEFYSLSDDPGETRNLAFSPDYSSLLDEYRGKLKKHTKETKDPFFGLHWNAAPRFRSHKGGYAGHEGPPAPAYIRE